ncbi:envelope glycoprotein B [Striga asiatica]|uniref:Envelope glycoprotein B n=1 Tax=Striga asiatica TaxID=4170 RepID=A0A5A7P896_STRAF|nr:envelope glycoprotein B [Striga asiatica]
MPPVDLETLVTAYAGDRKIACETLADNPAGGSGGEAPPDFPPESFLLSKDAEYEWFDRNAFYKRKDSTRGYTNSGNLNPNPNLHPHPHPHPSSNSSSQRFSANLKSKASIIGLPKSQKATFGAAKRRICRPPAIRLFPKLSSSAGKSSTPIEPGSPKVSCMGRVRSKRCRRRSNSRKRGEKPADNPGTGGPKLKAGFYSKVLGMFRSKRAERKSSRSGSRKLMAVVVEEEPAGLDQMRRSRSLSVQVGEVAAVESPGLGGMNRFASGRRSGSWASDDFN